MLEKHLASTCPITCRGNCSESVKRGPSGWFITMGHPGFNSTANNGRGYKSEALAKKAVRFYGSRGSK